MGEEKKKRRKGTEKKKDGKERNERKKERAELHCRKPKKYRGRGVNSTSITRFHRHLPHHLHGEAGNRRRKRGSSRKNEKRTEGVEIKRREQKEFLFVTVKREKEKGKQNREGGKEKRREENRKKQGKRKAAVPSPLPVSAPDLQNRREDRKAKTSREKGTKTELNAGDRRKQITKGKELEQTNTDRPASTPSTSLQLLRFSPGLLFNSACISWLHVLLLK